MKNDTRTVYRLNIKTAFHTRTQRWYCVTERRHQTSSKAPARGRTPCSALCARCGQVRTRIQKPADYSPAFVELSHNRLRISRNMYVKLCNFGKYTNGKSDPKKLLPDSGDECCDCTSLDFRHLTVHVTTNACFSPDPSQDIHRKLRVYRIVSLVLFVICVILLIVVLVLFIKCKYDHLSYVQRIHLTLLLSST